MKGGKEGFTLQHYIDIICLKQYIVEEKQLNFTLLHAFYPPATTITTAPMASFANTHISLFC
jgi:hypothetical protein